ncbi:glutamate synthase central domain-containing protein, partial [Rhizobium leguminosarum]|uniref:glutamate synthase central domain-containing protein n=1 Tax=Rhizobium leguminosarum TaxID=384 RepID=UPI003F9B732A
MILKPPVTAASAARQSRSSIIGPRPNILDHEGAANAKRLEVRQTILTNGSLERIRSIVNAEEYFDANWLDTTYDIERGAEGLP